MGSRTRSLHVIAKFALLLILTATLGGCVRMEDGGTSPTHLTLVSADGQRLDATATPLTEKPAIPEAAARERAGMALTDSKQATAVQAHFVALTLGTEATARHVWLITYTGVSFTSSGCTCHVEGATPKSVVAIDPQPGSSTMIFGVEDAQDDR